MDEKKRIVRAGARTHEEESIQEGGGRMRVEARKAVGERMSVGTFHSLSQQRSPRVASQTETGDRGLCMNFRSWLRETNR